MNNQNESIGELVDKLTKQVRENVAIQAYLECMSVERGEGECAKAIAKKFKLETWVAATSYDEEEGKK